MARYDDVNSLWPAEIPVPTQQEATAGVKALIRYAYTLARQDGQVIRRKFKGKFEPTSGNRYSVPRSGTWYVNAKGHHFGGWKDIVHDVSHVMHRRLWTGVKRGHSKRHEWIELEMTRYAVANFLAGQLAKPEAPKPDVRTVRAARVAKRLEAWKRKRARADTAIRKLTRQARYYGVDAHA